MKVSRSVKLPFGEVFKEEVKSYIDFNSNTKTVLAKENSKSGSSADKSVEKYSKIESKYGSSDDKPDDMEKVKTADDHSKSLDRSNTKSRKSSGNSRSNGRLPYGFVIPSSVEKVDEIL